MDKAQTDIPLGDIPNQERKSRNMDHGHADSPENDIHLSDILKPTTLIIGIVILVLVVLVGWYTLVLKPALNDNESMIHFMPPAEQLASNEADKPLAIAPNETVVATPMSAPVTAPTVQENKAAESAMGNSTPSQQPADTQTKTIKTATNKANSGHHQKSHAHKRAQDKRVGHAAHHPTLNEEQKCTQTQIALQQCAAYP